MKEILVKTENPTFLDETIQCLGGLVEQNADGSYRAEPDGSYVIRGTDINFLRFAIENQGYGEIVGERDIA